MLLGIYLGLGDHYEHTSGRDTVGVDLHDDIGNTLTPVFTENAHIPLICLQNELWTS